ncbi:uncharacterized protein LOC132194311 [Neocloeon triangulifer]|uniref:uncharacterized protein LOC132194311 n=1 Tax=Neocloeon triangulifer TaxID=2078957 RepID=UPI00286F5D45|nr:uncharacterized protein LOC132194311 [Neocloeon triangulifer]XP_059471473.1 uncharacterized protein LOC132194311 [Neocloeon triangulifer]
METERPDLSQLIPPLPTNTQGVHRLLSAYRSGTSEIKNMLSQECNIILECKICQNMFRSLPNFISHKRAYCLRPAPPLSSILHDNKLPEYYSTIKAIEGELGRRDIDRIATRLAKTATVAGAEGVRGENPEASQNVAYYTAIADTIKSRRAARVEHTTMLSPLPGTSKAVSQTVRMEVADDLETVTEYEPPSKKTKAKKGDEKPVNAVSTPKTNDSGKTPSISHSKGDKKKDVPYTVLQYPCPLCKKFFSKPNGAYRHIRDIHKKNNEQLERMKNTIRKKAFLVTLNKKPPRPQSPPANNNNNNPPPKPVHKPPPMVQASTQLSKAQQEELKEWNDHTFTIDVGDHRCGYCGTKYERRAALLAHAKQCSKKTKEAAKKPAIQALLKNKGAANRKISAPMKIVRKYLNEDRGKMANGAKSPLKGNLRRSARHSGPEDKKSLKSDIRRSKTNMFPTIPLFRVKVPSSAELVVINSKATHSPPKLPPPVAPLQTPEVIEKLLKTHKSNASNILVRQVSDKPVLSPSKPSTPIKEPPAIASITPILTVKPKDGYPVNYFSPGSAETKLIGGGNSVQSSIQIRKDYTKSTLSGDDSVDGSSSVSVCSDKVDECAEKPPMASALVSLNKSKPPVLNANKPCSLDDDVRDVKVKEMSEVVETLHKETNVDKNSSSDQEEQKKAMPGKKVIPEAKEGSDSDASADPSAKADTKLADTPHLEEEAKTNSNKLDKPDNLVQKEKKSSALAPPPPSLKMKIIKLRAPSNVSSSVLGHIPVRLAEMPEKVVANKSKSFSSAESLVRMMFQRKDLSSKKDSPTADVAVLTGKDLWAVSSAASSDNVPAISTSVPEKRCSSIKTMKVAHVVKTEPADTAKSNSIPESEKASTSSEVSLKRQFPNLNVPAEYLTNEEFLGWDSSKPLRPLSWMDEPSLILATKFFRVKLKATKNRNPTTR